MTVRSVALRVARTAPFAAFVGLLARLPAADNQLAVLTYHRIGDPERESELYPGLISATATQFAEHMEYVADRHRVIGTEELLWARDGGRLPPRSVLVTFDDAYADFADAAWPVIRRLRIPVILFVPTGYPDRHRWFWWDRLYAVMRRLDAPVSIPSPAGPIHYRHRNETESTFRRLVATAKSLPHGVAMEWIDGLEAAHRIADRAASVLSWDRLRELAAAGVTLAPHSVTHPRLDRLPDAEIEREVQESRAELDAATGISSPPIFAYPDGGHDERVVRAVGAAGFRVAFTTRRGANALATADWLRLRRINVAHSTPLAMVRAQLVAPWRMLGASSTSALTATDGGTLGR